MHPVDAITLGPLAWAAGMSVFNTVTWPSDPPGPDSPTRVSVLIPARNEASNIRACVEAALASEPPVHEVIVCDDGSEDQTPEILAEIADRDARLRVLQGQPLPEGWVGKPHACHQLGQVATGDLLVFLDADVTLASDAPRRLTSVIDRYDAGLATLFPRQIHGTVGEAVALPMLPLTFVSWFPLLLIPRHPDDRLLACSGQIMAFTRTTYDDIGGHAAIRADIVDDQAIARRTKQLGHRVVFATGTRTASCRMYEGFRALYEGFSKNLFELLDERIDALAMLALLYGLCFVWPFLRAGGELLALGTLSAPALAGLGLNLVARAGPALRLRQPLWSVLLQPAGAAVFLAVAVNSVRWSRSGQVRWRGRTYAARGER